MTQSRVTTRFTLFTRLAAITTLSFSCAYAGTVAADPLKVAIVLAGNITDRSFNQTRLKPWQTMPDAAMTW